MRLCSILLSAESKVQAKVKLKVNVLMSLQLLQMFVIIMHAGGVGQRVQKRENFGINNSNQKTSQEIHTVYLQLLLNRKCNFLEIIQVPSTCCLSSAPLPIRIITFSQFLQYLQLATFSILCSFSIDFLSYSNISGQNFSLTFVLNFEAFCEILLN